jgi:hypothetical protein
MRPDPIPPSLPSLLAPAIPARPRPHDRPRPSLLAVAPLLAGGRSRLVATPEIACKQAPYRSLPRLVGCFVETACSQTISGQRRTWGSRASFAPSQQCKGSGRIIHIFERAPINLRRRDAQTAHYDLCDLTPFLRACLRLAAGPRIPARPRPHDRPCPSLLAVAPLLAGGGSKLVAIQRSLASKLPTGRSRGLSVAL